MPVVVDGPDDGIVFTLYRDLSTKDYKLLLTDKLSLITREETRVLVVLL